MINNMFFPEVQQGQLLKDARREDGWKTEHTKTL